VTRPVFAIRPEPGLAATVSLARASGLDVVAEPLSEVCPVAWTPPSDGSFDSLLFGSANAIRHGGEALRRWRGRSAYVVGETTAEVAREAGFAIARTGSGGLQALLDELAPGARQMRSHGAGDMRLLRLAGERHLPLAVPEGITIQTIVIYRVVHLPVPETLERRLREGGTVLLHSAEAARHFADECERLALDRSLLAVAALSPRIAEAAGPGWRRIAASPTPADGALLELARDMCH